MKHFFNQYLFLVRKFLAKNLFEIARDFNEKILKKEIKDNPSILSLAPKVLTDEKELDKIKPYLTLLKQALKDKYITNIALTGNYGSGKSTVLKTFQFLNPEFSYLNVSLASFEASKENKKEELERRLEISILQQIFYHVKPSSIPDSKFRRIISFGRWKSIGLALSFIVWVYSIINIFKFNEFEKLDLSNVSFQFPIDWIYLINVCLFTIGIGIIVIKIAHTLSNSKINKVSVKGEIEIGDKIKKSVFNEHLEEILYFFEKTDFNVLVIEDLDRFENTQIFTKLREINTLLNNFETIRNKRKICFIYAVKDEVLKEKTERVKFFDLIIPIIPFINQSNAYEQLTTLIDKNGLSNVLSPEFTDDVISFINDIDMRLLINIFLEYMVFKENLSPELNQDSLFSIVTYKNLFPEDFSKLYRNEGDLFELINDKPKYLKELKDGIEIQISGIEKEIEKLENEFLRNTDAIRRLYLLKIIEKLPTIQSIEIKSELPLFEYLKEENFELLENNDKIKCLFIDNSSGYQRRSFKVFKFLEIEKEVNPETSFEERLSVIKLKEKQVKTALVKKIEELGKKINEIDSLDLAEIFKRLAILNYTKGATQSPLVKNLIINGYINEHYRNYISLFHEVSISQSDFNFLNSVLTGGLTPFNFKIEKTENLIKKISPKYFKRVSILNFEILDELISNKSFEKQKLNLFLFLSNENKEGIKFIYDYINRGINLEGFFYNLCANWKGFWDNIIYMDFSNETKNLYFRYIIEFGYIEDIIRFNEGTQNLIDFIQERDNFFELVSKTKNKNNVKKIIDRLDIKFLKIEKQNSQNKWIFDYIYDNNYYDINIYNINVLLENNLFNKSIYTSIYNSDLISLLHYVKVNINNFVKHVLLSNSESMQESVVAFLDLLNNPDLNIDLKSIIIKKQNGFVEQLSEISNLEVKKLLLNELKVIPYWMNVFDYYKFLEKESDLDDVLLGYLNNSDVFKKLEVSKINSVSNITNDEIESLSDKILDSKDLSFDSFEAIRRSIPFKYAWLNYGNLSEEKVKYAIVSKLVYLDIDGAKKLSEAYPEVRILLFEVYQNEFLNTFSDLDVTSEEIVQLLDSKEFELKHKFQLIKVMNQNLLVEDFKIASRACDLLAGSDYYPLSFSQLEYMFKFNFNWESKIEMLITHFATLDFDEIQMLSKRLTSDGYYSELFKKQHKPTFEKNSFNEAFFELLESKSYIKRFEINRWNKNEYRVIANY